MIIDIIFDFSDDRYYFKYPYTKEAERKIPDSSHSNKSTSAPSLEHFSHVTRVEPNCGSIAGMFGSGS
jgi:hypothetical protein